VHTIFKLGERMAAIGQTKRENGSTRGKKRDSKSQCRRDW